MILYITAEDVLGSETPRRRGPRPLPTPPETLPALFDLGLRHHARSFALAFWAEEALERVPDWKLDRLAIRLALFGRERLGLEPGTRVAVIGRLGWLWPAMDFAAMGFGVVPVGIEHGLRDAEIAEVLAQALPRAVFASDGESARRLLALRAAGRLVGATIVAEGLSEEPGLQPLIPALEGAAILDTPERAQAFRAFSRQVDPQAQALWHAGPGPLVRLTHRQATAQASSWLQARPAREGDVAYLDAPRMTLRRRLALAAFVGDGCTTAVLGREGRAVDDLTVVRPQKVLASGPWLGAACDGLTPGWPAALARAWTRRRVLKKLGGRVRWIDCDGSLPSDTVRALEGARIALDIVREEEDERSS
jgi:hypothetical protein